MIWINFEDKIIHYLMHNMTNTNVLQLITAFLHLGFGKSSQLALIWIPRPSKT
jgi:hypothetical protein